jgi:hypothetical protein
MVLAEIADPYLNLSGLVCVNPAFLATERAKTGSLYTPEDFYGGLPPVQWWGVANGLVAEQSLYLPVEQHVQQSVHAYPPVIAVLHGSGGMGKSVLLRRLGAYLVRNCDVSWLNNPQALLDEQKEAQTKILSERRAMEGRRPRREARDSPEGALSHCVSLRASDSEVAQVSAGRSRQKESLAASPRAPGGLGCPVARS